MNGRSRLYKHAGEMDLIILQGDQQALADLINRKMVPGLRYTILPYTCGLDHTFFMSADKRDGVASCQLHNESDTTLADNLYQGVVRLKHACSIGISR